MNKGNDSFQVNNNITDNSSYQQISDLRINQSAKQKNFQSAPKDNDLNINLQTMKQRNVLNEFKVTLAETEKYTSVLNSNLNSHLNSSKSIFNQINDNNAFSYNNYDETIADNSSIEIIEDDTPFNRLKISNDVLLKTNLDLRNTNKILKDEIEAYKNSSVYKSPYSQYDVNLNDFISSIKQALNTSQMSNLELQEIVTQAQKKAESLSKENEEIVKHYEIVKGEFEVKTKEASELKVILSNRDNQIAQLNAVIQELNNKIKELDDRIFDNEKQINFQMTINASYNQYKEDSEEMLKSLKETIESFQKGNVDHQNKSNQLQNQINDLHSQLMSSESIIEKLNQEIQSKDSDIRNQFEHFGEMEKIMQQLKDTITNKQNEIRQLNGNIDKLNAQVESLNLFIEDREKTITTLKASLGILTKTFDNDLSAIKSTSNDSLSVQMILNDKIEELNKHIDSQDILIKEMNKENEALRQDCGSLKNEINDYINQFEQNQYEYQLLYQRYKEQTGLIETLKIEFLNKRNDNELMNLIKANEDILRKLQKIQEDNKAKTEEINDLKANYSKISRELFEAQRLNTSLETQNNYIATSVNHKNNSNNNNNIRANHYYSSEINDLEESVSSQEGPPLISIQNNQKKGMSNMTGSDITLFFIIDMSYVISFNFQNRIFTKLEYIDKSGNFLKLFDQFASFKVNFSEGLFIITKSFVFYFNPRDHSIKQVAKCLGLHSKSSCIYINDELYIISGENTKQCEKVSFHDWKISQLPDMNYSRCNSGLCFVNNQYLFSLFGECEQRNTIERLNIQYKNSSWEIMKYKPNLSQGFNMLSHFLCFSNDNQIIITGGIDEKRECNQRLLRYDYHTAKLEPKGKSKCYALFNSQISQIDNNLLANFDTEGNLHLFDKEVSFYEIYKVSFDAHK